MHIFSCCAAETSFIQNTSIKKQFTNNSYEVITKNSELSDNEFYKVINKKEDVFQIQLTEGASGKDALAFINDNYEVISYKKETPSIEDIFIKAVNNE